MIRNALLIVMLVLSVALPLSAQPQQEGSLGDLARQLREQREKYAKKASKVFTNDDLPVRPPWEYAAAQGSQPAPGGQPPTPAPTTAKPDTPPPSHETSIHQPESPEDKERDYWRGKFKAARREVAKSKELQQLAEDEMNLLQIQQVRELDLNAKADLTAKMQAKQSEVDVNKATTEAAQKALDDLEKEFKDSGAPDDWSQTN